MRPRHVYTRHNYKRHFYTKQKKWSVITGHWLLFGAFQNDLIVYQITLLLLITILLDLVFVLNLIKDYLVNKEKRA